MWDGSQPEGQLEVAHYSERAWKLQLKQTTSSCQNPYIRGDEHIPWKKQKGGCGLKRLTTAGWEVQLRYIMQGVKSNFPSAQRCWALKQCSVRCIQTALHCRGEVVAFLKLIEKEFGSHRRSAGLSYFRSTLAYFLCVQPDITDASQLWTLKEAEWLQLQLAQGLQGAPKSSSGSTKGAKDVPWEPRAAFGSQKRMWNPASPGCLERELSGKVLRKGLKTCPLQQV